MHEAVTRQRVRRRATPETSIAVLLLLARPHTLLPKRHFPPCVQREARSQHHEDLRLLVPLLCMAAHGAPPTFVELGAFTGVDLSNTVMMERCYNWTGVLIEGSPANYALLEKSGRTSPMIHSAVCQGTGTVRFASDGGGVGDRSGEPDLRPKGIVKESF